jgi:hypothetical protein
MFVSFKGPDGRLRQVNVGIAWTPLFFGGLRFFFRGMPIKGVLWTILCWTLLVPAIYLMCAMNRMTAKHWLTRGYEPVRGHRRVWVRRRTGSTRTAWM